MKKKLLLILMLVLVLAFGAGCSKYEYVEIKPNESAFVFPLEGDTKENQVSFDSQKYLEEKKVAAKRIKIPYKKYKTSVLGWGKRMATLRVIKINRSPVTREWTNTKDSGTSVQNQAIEAESKGSIAYSAKMNATAKILKKDAARYLYEYNTKALSSVMDTEIRPMVESTVAELSGNMELEEIIANKDKLFSAIRKKVIPYFKDKGITITVLGLKGQLELNPEIQKAINQKFQEEKELAAQRIANQRRIEKAEAESQARLNQQEIENKRKLAEAEAKAKAVKMEAEAEAGATLAKARADAKAAELKNKYLEVILRQQELDNQRVFFENLELPKVISGDGQSILQLLNLKDMDSLE